MLWDFGIVKRTPFWILYQDPTFAKSLDALFPIPNSPKISKLILNNSIQSVFKGENENENKNPVLPA
jgi:hypothetical protein